MRTARILVPLLCAIAAGCAQIQPFATIPAPPIEGKPDPRTRVGLCYDPMWSPAAKLQDAAQGECAAGTTAEKVDDDYLMAYCPVLLPARATFACTPKK